MFQDLDPSVKAILDWRVGVEISKEKQKSVLDRWGIAELRIKGKGMSFLAISLTSILPPMV